MTVTPPELPKGYYFEVTQGHTKDSGYSVYSRQVNAKVRIMREKYWTSDELVKAVSIPATYDGSTPSDEVIREHMEKVLDIWKKVTSFAGDSPFGRYPRTVKEDSWWDKLMTYFSPKSEGS